VWWCISVIPAIQEVEGGGTWSKVSLGKRVRPYLKNELHKKWLGCNSSGKVLVYQMQGPQLSPSSGKKLKKTVAGSNECLNHPMSSYYLSISLLLHHKGLPSRL
jgi:hypothetical protein